MGNHESDGLTRRETLKRGLKIGAVLWVTPVVQAIGMRPAFAQTTSPVPCEETVSFRAKSVGSTSWEEDPGFGTNDCITCGGADGVDGSLYFTISGDEDEATVTLTNPGCEITSIAAAGGRPGIGRCIDGEVADGGQSATVGRPPNGGISHVEVCFTCCEDNEDN